MKTYTLFNAKKPHKTSQRGFTLIELSIVLAIVAVVIVGSLIGVQSILRNNRVNTINKTIPLIVANVTKNYATVASFEGLTSQVAWGLGAFPEGIRVATAPASATLAHATTPFANSRIDLAPFNGNVGFNTPNQTFALYIGGIPNAACADIVTGLDGADAIAISVSDTAAGAVTTPPTALPGVTVKNIPAAGATTQLNPAGIGSACTGNQTTKTIVAIFGRA